jgi:hypothetical protein
LAVGISDNPSLVYYCGKFRAVRAARAPLSAPRSRRLDGQRGGAEERAQPGEAKLFQNFMMDPAALALNAEYGGLWAEVTKSGDSKGGR